ncbi:uncharacterized protein LOC136093433 [Hydra vulgaris]|uniref:uncharacterized protein LOC136093433 n=1 Tax=Hydra vulgaris TaxID=6087 RepID=UPI0032EA5C7B
MFGSAFTKSGSKDFKSSNNKSKQKTSNAIRIQDLAKDSRVKKGQGLRTVYLVNKKMATFGKLNITEKPIIDESIEKDEYHEYPPKITNFDNPGTEISMTINEENLIVNPCKTFILIEGRLLKADRTSYANADAATLIHNGLMYLFTRAEYLLSGQTVENIINLGRATTMLGLLKYPIKFDEEKEPNTKGKFSFCVPLKYIFGFCDVYDKALYGLTHTLTLIRESDNNAIFRAAGTAAGQVNLTKVSLFMPHVKPHLEYELKLNKEIESKVPLSLSYAERRSESITVPQTTDFTWTLNITSSSTRPRYIIVGFQTNKNNNQEQNPTIFDHCDLKNMYVKPNSRSYPEIVYYNLSFPDQQFTRAYNDVAQFNEKFYEMSELISQCNISTRDYKPLYSLFVYDVSKQKQISKPSIINIQVIATFSTPVLANTMAYAVIISDRLGQLISDESKLQYIY